MRLCFVVDGRTMHARNWMSYFIRNGHKVHLISTYPCSIDDLGVASFHVVALDFSARVRTSSSDPKAKTEFGSPFFSAFRGGAVWNTLALLRDKTAPFAIRLQRNRVRRIVEQINPDLVHAMRIPFEGLLLASAVQKLTVPLVISIWGNDFTLAASSSAMLKRWTQRALKRANGLHPDCHRDLRLARELGFAADKPAAVLPGNGGVHCETFHPGSPDPLLRAELGIPEDAHVVLNPRGVKPYIRNDMFFQSIPLVLRRLPKTIFLGGMMKGNATIEGWISRLNIADSVKLLPFLPHVEMANIFRLADVMVSPSDHDGTTNAMLEAMACGVFPVVGNIESVREWIDHDVNGFLCDQGNPESIADAIVNALNRPQLRESAKQINQRLIAERAEYTSVMARAESFYGDVRRHAAASTAR